MAVDVQTEIVIERPCAEVAAYAADPSRAPDWYVNIESVSWQTPPPVMVAAMRRATRKDLANLKRILEGPA